MIFALVLAAAEPAGEVATASIAMPAAAPAPVELQIGTAVPLVLRDRISTKTCAKGDVIHMDVADDVAAGGRVVIPKGSSAIGELTRCDPKGAFGKAGKIEARALYVTVNDHPVRITGVLAARGEGGTTETVLTLVAVGLFAFAVTGKSAEILPGTRVDAILDRTVRF